MSHERALAAEGAARYQRRDEFGPVTESKQDWPTPPPRRLLDEVELPELPPNPTDDDD